jgi:hypothetical protein
MKYFGGAAADALSGEQMLAELDAESPADLPADLTAA